MVGTSNLGSWNGQRLEETMAFLQKRKPWGFLDCYNLWRSMHLNDIQCYDVLSHSTYYILYLTIKNEACLETTSRSTAPILAKMSNMSDFLPANLLFTWLLTSNTSWLLTSHFVYHPVQGRQATHAHHECCNLHRLQWPSRDGLAT